MLNSNSSAETTYVTFLAMAQHGVCDDRTIGRMWSASAAINESVLIMRAGV